MQLLKNIIKSDDWEQRANKIISHFNWHSPDEIDMYDICWRYGVIIKPLESPFLDPEICFESVKHLKAFSMPSKKARRGTIYIAHNLNAIEKKMLLAEEFCHIYSHFSSQLELDEHYISKQENQAKRMAAYLLMPSKFLIQVYESATNEPILISDIADQFLVSEEFAQFRLELTFKHKVDGFIQLKERLWSIEYF